MISLGQAGGLSLDEIKTMLSPAGIPQISRGLLRAKADQIDTTIKYLRNMRDGLRHVAECSAPNHEQCPTFQRIVKLAARAKLKQMK